MSLAKQIANDLYKIKAIQIKPDRSFTWTSGIKSPIYCDNRLTMSYPEIRSKIATAFVEKIKALDVQPDVIAGCATAGIPHAAWLAEKLDLPMIYVRDKAKAHGKGNQIEGQIEPGQKVIVVEDLISTGGSSLNSALALREEGTEVLGVMAIFTYGLEQAKMVFDEKQIPLSTITNFDVLIEQLLEAEAINEKEKSSLLEWRNTLALG
ncbi:orotate phosphoribosyltransferase [Paraliobacillus quinghaiensis]|uniref:Orotate phosphoribosyltransferase n=1 Tax=Paraliobacillus quinghaiensis TaxID=470815 RepID=A0A917TEU2_9BACI|nr:orotate phosphoribosyltransferase [Paraliobacillus quinghaiensis]GGM20881.1 orotate phosphoribosyltransferase [Paraliobacillus quinghaiensis]